VLFKVKRKHGRSWLSKVLRQLVDQRIKERGDNKMTTVESRGKRGIFGNFVKYTFIAFNAFMVFWMVTETYNGAKDISKMVSGPEQTGSFVGLVIFWAIILFILAFGDMMLGLFLMLTRGKKIIHDNI
jgi:hypothetical protein